MKHIDPLRRVRIIREALLAVGYVCIQGLLMYGSAWISSLMQWPGLTISVLCVFLPTLFLAIMIPSFRKWALIEFTVMPVLSYILYKNAFAFLDIFVMIFFYLIIPGVVAISVILIPVLIISAIIVGIKQIVRKGNR